MVQHSFIETGGHLYLSFLKSSCSSSPCLLLLSFVQHLPPLHLRAGLFICWGHCFVPSLWGQIRNMLLGFEGYVQSLCLFSVAAITNYHKHITLNNIYLLSHTSVSQTRLVCLLQVSQGHNQGIGQAVGGRLMGKLGKTLHSGVHTCSGHCQNSAPCILALRFLCL